MRAGILGASGYGGAGLIERILRHPHLSLAAIASRQYLGQPLEAAWPHLVGLNNANLLPSARSFVDSDDAIASCDVLFCATPHGATAPWVATARAAGKMVVDLSADFRLSASDYGTWYGTHPHPDLIPGAVYGLPELHRAELAGANLIASPGCNATAATLALAPLATSGLLRDPVATIVTGVSGAGRATELGLHYPELNENARAYKVAGTHRHSGEIEMNLGRLLAQGRNLRSHAAQAPVTIAFNPVLVPMNRGILATAVARPERSDLSDAQLLDLYSDFFARDPMVVVQRELPQTKAVSGSDRALVSVRWDARAHAVVALCAIDNLGKGASGQALQAFNLARGYDETTSLRIEGVWP